jgi:hypothetical protein
MRSKLLIGLLVLFCAIAISAVAAYFSVVGLGALFAATFIPVVIMGTVLEGSKLVAAGWLHANWRNRRVSRLHKSYMLLAIAALMLITSMGVYGFLARGHLEQAATAAPVQIEIAQKEERLKQLNGDLSRYNAQQSQINDTTSAFLRNDDAKAGLRARQSMGAERRGVQKNIDSTNSEINQINKDLVPLRVKSSATEAKLGPVKYVAALFGWTDPEAAVRLIILILMFAFDPLAVVMMVSSTITLGEWLESRRPVEPKLDPPAAPVVEPAPLARPPEPEAPPAQATEDEPVFRPSPNPGTWGYVAEPVIDFGVKEPMAPLAEEPAPEEVRPADQLVEILEQHPELLQNIIDAVETPKPKIIHWLDDPTPDPDRDV